MLLLMRERERHGWKERTPFTFSMERKKILEFDLVLFIIHQPDKYPVGIIYW